MQNDSFKMRQRYAPYNRSEESHRRTDGAYTLSLKSWDISLTLNMTDVFTLWKTSKNYAGASLTTCARLIINFKLKFADILVIFTAENIQRNTEVGISRIVKPYPPGRNFIVFRT